MHAGAFWGRTAILAREGWGLCRSDCKSNSHAADARAGRWVDDGGGGHRACFGAFGEAGGMLPRLFRVNSPEFEPAPEPGDPDNESNQSGANDEEVSQQAPGGDARDVKQRRTPRVTAAAMLPRLFRVDSPEFTPRPEPGDPDYETADGAGGSDVTQQPPGDEQWEHVFFPGATSAAGDGSPTLPSAPVAAAAGTATSLQEQAPIDAFFDDHAFGGKAFAADGVATGHSEFESDPLQSLSIGRSEQEEAHGTQQHTTTPSVDTWSSSDNDDTPARAAERLEVTEVDHSSTSEDISKDRRLHFEEAGVLRVSLPDANGDDGSYAGSVDDAGGCKWEVQAVAFHPFEESIAVSVVACALSFSVCARDAGSHTRASVRLVDVPTGATMALGRVPESFNAALTALDFAPGPPLTLVGVAAGDNLPDSLGGSQRCHASHAVLVWRAAPGDGLRLLCTVSLDDMHTLLTPTVGQLQNKSLLSGSTRAPVRPPTALLSVAKKSTCSAGSSCRAFVAFAGESAQPAAVRVNVPLPSKPQRGRIDRAPDAFMLSELPAAERSATNSCTLGTGGSREEEAAWQSGRESRSSATSASSTAASTSLSTVAGLGTAAVSMVGSAARSVQSVSAMSAAVGGQMAAASVASKSPPVVSMDMHPSQPMLMVGKANGTLLFYRVSCDHPARSDTRDSVSPLAQIDIGAHALRWASFCASSTRSGNACSGGCALVMCEGRALCVDVMDALQRVANRLHHGAGPVMPFTPSVVASTMLPSDSHVHGQARKGSTGRPLPRQLVHGGLCYSPALESKGSNGVLPAETLFVWDGAGRMRALVLMASTTPSHGTAARAGTAGAQLHTTASTQIPVQSLSASAPRCLALHPDKPLLCTPIPGLPDEGAGNGCVLKFYSASAYFDFVSASATDAATPTAATTTQWLGASRSGESAMSQMHSAHRGVGAETQSSSKRMPFIRVGSSARARAVAACAAAHAPSLYALLPVATDTGVAPYGDTGGAEPTASPPDSRAATSPLEQEGDWASVSVPATVPFVDGDKIRCLNLADTHSSARSGDGAFELVGTLPAGFEATARLIFSRPTGVMVAFGENSSSGDAAGAYVIRHSASAGSESVVAVTPLAASSAATWTPEYVSGGRHGAFFGEDKGHLVLLCKGDEHGRVPTGPVDTAELKEDGVTGLWHYVVGERGLEPFEDAFASALLPLPATAMFAMPHLGSRAALLVCFSDRAQPRRRVLALVSDIASVPSDDSLITSGSFELGLSERVLDAVSTTFPVDDLVARTEDVVAVVVLTDSRVIVLLASSTEQGGPALRLVVSTGAHASSTCSAHAASSARYTSMVLGGPCVFLLDSLGMLSWMTFSGRTGPMRALPVPTGLGVSYDVGGLSLAAVLPDRVVYTASGDNGGQVCAYEIAVGLLEPLAIGFLDLASIARHATPHGISSKLPDDFTITWLRCALGVYSAANATPRLVRALLREGYATLASAVADVAHAAGRVSAAQTRAVKLHTLDDAQLSQCAADLRREFERNPAFPGLLAEQATLDGTACGQTKSLRMQIRDLAAASRRAGDLTTSAIAADMLGNPWEALQSLLAARSVDGVVRMAANAAAAAYELKQRRVLRQRGSVPAAGRYDLLTLGCVHATCMAWLRMQETAMSDETTTAAAAVAGASATFKRGSQSSPSGRPRALLLDDKGLISSKSGDGTGQLTLAPDKAQVTIADCVELVSARAEPDVTMRADADGARTPHMRTRATLWDACQPLSAQDNASARGAQDRAQEGSVASFSWPSRSPSRPSGIGSTASGAPSPPATAGTLDLEDLMAFSPRGEDDSTEVSSAVPGQDLFGADPFGVGASIPGPGARAVQDSDSDDDPFTFGAKKSKFRVHIRGKDEAIAPAAAVPKLDIRLGGGEVVGTGEPSGKQFAFRMSSKQRGSDSDSD